MTPCLLVVPSALKTAVTPVLKKQNWFKQFLQLSSREGVVTSQLHNHLMVNNLFEPLLSEMHSTETALVKVVNDLLSYAPKLWISLPADIREAKSLHIFKTCLKKIF